MGTLLWILISTFVVSIISFIGVFTFFVKKKSLDRILIFLVALSAGGLMGGAFLHLIPEALEGVVNFNIFFYLLTGFVVFFLIEKILHWRHCHNGVCPVHTFAYMNLIGDTVHNFIDGLIIAAAFVTNVSLGIATTIAVALHEIPQEMGDFGVLVYGGFKKSDALFLNFVTALTAILGGLSGYYVFSYFEFLIKFLILFAAGGFIYIAASDLIPEIREEGLRVGFKKSLLNFGVFIIGILVMYAFRLVLEG